jgi:glycosyltransferase involved in cell wall biosynthesis
MHWHGTDIRTYFYQSKSRPAIEWGAERAAHVLYATPDLREHAVKARPDATYLPIPIDFSELPSWKPVGSPRVVFSSRWDESKGGDTQLALLRELRSGLDKNVLFEGLDWGDRAEEARALGVQLVPRMAKDRFLQWMAGAHCVVGQTTGILATSELQAVAMGAPTVTSVRPGYYPGSPFPVEADAEGITQRVREVLEDPISASTSSNGASWVRRHHGPETLVPELAAIYRAAAKH